MFFKKKAKKLKQEEKELEIVEEVVEKKYPDGSTIYSEDELELTVKLEGTTKTYCMDFIDNPVGCSQTALFNYIVNDKDLQNIDDLVIGGWGAEEMSCDEDGPKILIDLILNNKDKFSHIKHFKFGYVNFEVCELSWINQCSYNKFINEMKNLESLYIQGMNEKMLSDEKVSSSTLKSLSVKTSGLTSEFVKNLINTDLPNLETLYLFIGTDDYGSTVTIDELAELLNSPICSNVTDLSLVDSEMQDRIVGLVLDNPILSRLKKLDFSYGTLTDEGGQLLLDNAEALKSLESLKIEYHFLSEEMVDKLENSSINVDLSDRQEEEDYGAFPLYTE